jgi:hypothetical protein
MIPGLQLQRDTDIALRTMARRAALTEQANAIKQANRERSRAGERSLFWREAVEHLVAKGLVADDDTKPKPVTLRRRLERAGLM